MRGLTQQEKDGSMQKTKQIAIARVRAMLIGTFAVGGVLFALFPLIERTPTELSRCTDDSETAVPDMAPWANIGGCGAGGSGGGGGGAKWVGYGVSGGLLDVEMMYSKSIGQNFFNDQLKTRFSGKPTWTTTLGLSVPIVSKIGEVQPVSNQDPRYYITGGLGDVSVDWSKSLGMEGQYSLGLSLTLPTAQYDIKRGKDASTEFLPASLQKGGGLYSASLTLGWTKDVEDGMWMVDLSYAHPFNMKLFTGENRFMDEYWQDYTYYKDEPDSPQHNRFYYRFKPYGETDLGAYSPPNLTLSAYFGYRGVEHYVHSWGITFSAPLDTAYIHGEPTTSYKPRPDPDHKAWSATLNYGLEFSRSKFPVFLAVSLPFNDKGYEEGNPDKTYGWDAPDMKDFMQQWTFSIGMKTTMF